MLGQITLGGGLLQFKLELTYTNNLLHEQKYYIIDNIKMIIEDTPDPM
jgi:hypothetical protein